jgi:hypothetical protein
MKEQTRAAAVGGIGRPPSVSARTRARRLYPDARATGMRRYYRTSAPRGGSGLFR